MTGGLAGVRVGKDAAGQVVVDGGGGRVVRVRHIDAGSQHGGDGISATGQSALGALVGALGQRLGLPVAAEAVLRHSGLPGPCSLDGCAGGDRVDLGFDRTDEQAWGERVNGFAPHPRPSLRRCLLPVREVVLLGVGVAT